MASALGIGSAGKQKGLALRCRHCSGTEDQRNAAATRGHKAEIFQVRVTCQNLLALFSPYCMNVYFFCFFFPLRDASISLFPQLLAPKSSVQQVVQVQNNPVRLCLFIPVEFSKMLSISTEMQLWISSAL